MTCSEPSGAAAAPHLDERVLGALAADRRLVGVTGQHARLVRERHEDVHDRGAHLLEVPAADGVLEQRVAREDDVVDGEGDHVVGVPGCRRPANPQAAPLPLAGLGDDVDVVPRAQLVLVRDVIGVRVGAQDRCRGRPPALHRGDERPHVGARVDEKRRPALAIGDHEGVREPVRMHALLDQHGARLTATLKRRTEWPACGSASH